MRTTGVRPSMAVVAGFVVLVAVPSAWGERGAEAQPSALPARTAPPQEHHRVLPEHLAIGSPYEQYIRDTQQRLTDIAKWVEDLRVAAAERTKEQDRNTMADLARNVERQLEPARERFGTFRASEITRRDAARLALNNALRELTVAFDEARAVLWERFGMAGVVQDLMPKNVESSR